MFFRVISVIDRLPQALDRVTNSSSTEIDIGHGSECRLLALTGCVGLSVRSSVVGGRPAVQRHCRSFSVGPTAAASCSPLRTAEEGNSADAPSYRSPATSLLIR